MIEYGLPYDFILPYEDTDIVLRYKYVNKHIKFGISSQADDFHISIDRMRRNKSVIPNIGMS